MQMHLFIAEFGVLGEPQSTQQRNIRSPKKSYE